MDIPGFAKVVRENIRLNANMTLAVDFKLQRSTLKEEIVVIGRTPTIDVKSSAPAGVTISSDLLMDIPIAKNISELLGISMGVDGDNALGYGEGTWMIDGIVINDNYSGEVNFDPDFNIIKEASVRTLGLPAEYGGTTGTVVNVVTKSGSNSFSGLAEVRLHGLNWNSQNTGGISVEDWQSPILAQRDYLTNDYYDLGLQFGGKIITDKLWYFVSGEYKLTNAHMPGAEGKGPIHDPKLFLKMDYQIDQRNRINVSFNWQEQIREKIGLGMGVPEEWMMNSTRPRWSLNSNWSSILGSNTFLDVKLGYYTERERMDPAPGMEDVAGGVELTDSIAPFRNNLAMERVRSDSQTYHMTAHLSHYLPDFFMGSHDFKAGVELKFGSNNNLRFDYPGDALYYYYQGTPLYGYLYESFDWKYKNRSIDAFVQDSWTIGKRLTINAGLRMSNNWMRNPSLGSTITLDDISFSPRIGFAYDILGDRKNVIKFHYGLYRSSIVDSWFTLLGTKVGTTQRLMWSEDQWVPVESYPSVNFSNCTMDPDLGALCRGISVSFERELFKNASLEINAFYKPSREFVGAVLMNGEYDLTQATCPGPDGVLGNEDDFSIPYWYQTNWMDDPAYSFTNPRKGQSAAMTDDPKFYSAGLGFVFNKRMANRWQLMISYVYGVSRGNTTSLYFGTGDNPNYFTYADKKNGNYGEPHNLRIQGSVILPLDINLGLIGSYISGQPRAAFSFYMTPAGYSYGMVTGWGKYRLPGRKNISLRLDKRFQLKDRKALTILVNIDNVFNWNGVIERNILYGPTFYKISGVQSPRSFEIGARYWF